MSTTPETQEASPPATVRSGTGGIHVMQVMYFFLIAFAAAVVLFFFRLPPIFPAILIGVAIGFVTFYSLGGIESSTKFSLGPVNVSGSLAAIVAVTFGINHLLSNQIIDPENAFPGAQWLAVTTDLDPVDSVQIGSWGIMPSPRVSLNSSTPLDLDKNGNDYQVSSLTRPDIALGKVSRDTLDELVDISFPMQQIETFKTRRLQENTRATDLDDSGLDFPFYLETGRFNISSFYTLKDKATDSTLFRGSLRRNQYQIAVIEGKTYFITTAQVDHTLDKVLPNDSSYVQFIIGELKPTKKY